MTDTYGVGDRGLHPLERIDASLVEAYRSGRRSDGPVVMERYLAFRLRSIGATETRLPAERDRALLDYVKTREAMLMIAHRFFGEPGLSAMRRAYDSPEDRTVLASLRTSREAGTLPFAPSETRLRGDVDLLLAAPVDFIPCRVRVPTAGGAAR